jgi:sulfur carrier protein
MNPPQSVTLQLDGQAHAVPRGTTLTELVASLGHAANSVGTAVNGVFVARGQRGNRVLKQDDAVLLFRPIVGG